ncbi:MAG: Chromosome segregation ATPases [uncultured Nocardioidaceae bacterium]|uniref:Chromosome segregation ATPases n=1 Tax=uncultured Nocardioidaceae bacterium TaxID=253824 RepID=A0A6J4LHY5_9ACTN|nr:MAG: Chromosome segregation ATPases [uncultured Nocardioidaceae bacterium]
MTEVQTFGSDEVWRLEQWLESLNDLGFDIDEMDIVSEAAGSAMRVQPRVVEAGHHSRELRTFTGLDVEEAQARRLLNDMAGFSAHLAQTEGQSDRPREVIGHRWLTEIYEPLIAMMPTSLRGAMEEAEFFHEVLVHRWYLSERAGREVNIFDTASDYVATVVSGRPEETALPLEI